MKNKNLLDDTDREILEFLSENARTSNREIAQKMGVAEGTIRSRIKRMVDERSIRFSALSREENQDTATLCYVGLRVDLANTTAVATSLCAFHEARFVARTLGRFDIFAVVVVSSVEGLNRFVSDRVMPLEGVRRVHTSIVTNMIKYDHRWGRVT
ncbi:Lrp/AsnC family transcriptional regulator [Henriciella litoralis]|uniref:Lrp/AsnC family transcriptional regulator n=1 Tax=Henriciella litoralis TaxID=568102 RepID=UPI000A043746|nr:Lrp/AsnC family transcriptional regulator [Henriciella litoralis]